MEKYLAFDGINGEHEWVDNIEDAHDFLKEIYYDKREGYHPDLELCAIYKLHEKLEIELVASKEDYTEEEWEQEYDINFDEVWKVNRCKTDDYKYVEDLIERYEKLHSVLDGLDTQGMVKTFIDDLNKLKQKF